MDKVAIDYSLIPETVDQKSEDWDPPRHVFFGSRDPVTGKMSKEPVYTHKSLPAMLYRMEGGLLRAQVAQDEPDLKRLLAAGWSGDLASLGVITAPSRAQIEESAELDRMVAAEAKSEKATITLKSKVPA